MINKEEKFLKEGKILDDNMPYYNILMKRPEKTSLKLYPLPEGYRFVLYQPGDEVDWAEIETSVNEFKHVSEALNYFNEVFLPYHHACTKRMLFLENPEGKKIGTFTAWWHSHQNISLPNVYWVGIRPEEQGNHGLGKALISKGIQLMIENDGDVALYLHTQPSSFRAITIYRQCGFEFYEVEKEFMGYTNETYEGVQLLKDLKLLKF